MLALFYFARTSWRWQKQHCLLLMGLSFGSLSGKILIPADRKIELPPSELEYSESTFAHIITQWFQKSGLVHIWGMMAGCPSKKNFQNPRGCLWFPATHFSSVPDLISCSVLWKPPSPVQVFPTYTRTYTQKQGRGSERSPSPQVLQDYLDVMNKIASSIEALRTNENYQCVTQLHFSFVCLSLEQNRFYK